LAAGSEGIAPAAPCILGPVPGGTSAAHPFGQYL